MATTSATPERLAKAQDAVDFLRAAGREEEAVAVESLLPPRKPRRLPPAPPNSEREHDLVPIAEAATRLGLSRNAVQRRIDTGLLQGTRDERNGYRFVTRASLNELLTLIHDLEVVSSTSFYLDKDQNGPDSLFAQMVRHADELDGRGRSHEDSERDEA